MVSVTASYSPKYILLEALNNGPALPFLTTAQQTFVGLEDVLKTSSTRLQRNNLRLPRRLEDVLQRRFEDVLEDEKLLR